MAEAHGLRKRPWQNDPLLDLLFARGVEHEKAYVESLRAEGRGVVDLSNEKDRDAVVAQTLNAMRAGAGIIVQAALRDGRWFGRPDVLLRVETPSDLGTWSYEVSDTKLARDTRGGTILQLALYSDMLAGTQGTRPARFCVVTPESGTRVHVFRVDDYAAYFRLMRAKMEATVALDDEAVIAAHYSEPVEHCEVCPWSPACRRQREVDDHLSLVAGISRRQRRVLESQAVATLTSLARLPSPMPFTVKRGCEGYERIQQQARLQLESRGRVPPLYEIRPVEEGAGLSRLPEPSPGDVFLDLEGDPFATEGGREYLFGLVTVDANGEPSYRSFWALAAHEERAAFEAVIDLIVQATRAHSGMHVYHYAPYEPSAFKRLMGRYATREDQLDELLRAERFVDLYAVVRHGVRAGVDRYSIKNLEPFYAFERSVALKDANRGLRIMEQGLEMQCPELVPQDARDIVQAYNRDDCLSTLRLRNWLEELRTELEATGTPVLRPLAKEGEPSDKVDARAERVAALRDRLLVGVPEPREDRNTEQQARWLLAYMLDWHRREDKAGWWEYYRLCALPEEDLFEEPQAIAGLEHVKRVGPAIGKHGKPTKSMIERYRYPVQEMEIEAGDELKLQDRKTTLGAVCKLDRAARTIDIVQSPKQASIHPSAAFAHRHVPSDAQENALYAIGDSIARRGSVSADPGTQDSVAQQLLLARPPRLKSAAFVARANERASDFAVRVAGELDETVLAIQGPPGAGKTYTGARMICELIAQGKTVGITATSHKVIRNLLDAISKRAAETRTVVRLAHKAGEDEVATPASSVTLLHKNETALQALQDRDVQVLGATAWLWARPEFAQAVDVLFVDEAGQMSLANVLAISRAGKSLVLLGDPQQLDQPQKGTHPEGVNASALEHMLGEHQTIPADRGIFLSTTWRLAPAICQFTSELFYEGKLASKPGLEHQSLAGVPGLDGSGLWFLDVHHDGNRNAAPEEVEAVRELIARLTAPGAHWIDELGTPAQLSGRDILVVTPYNAQVTRLVESLDDCGVSVGTVDKFQGQQAPVAIYSMATSRPEDAPRGMEFLYNPHRLNVATSRARCAAILVASPLLFEPECKTPRQMKLANALCRYREMARPVRL
jgi:predicted RecB family nuclease